MFEGTECAERRTRLLWFLLIALTAIVILVPRLALLFNAPDVERTADTYIHEAFAFGQAAADNRLGEFIFSVHKYPLLGPYLAVPVIGLYYVYGRAVGSFDTPADFADTYVLGETALPFLFRVESLVFNLLTLFLIFKTAQKFSSTFRFSGLFALLAASVSFYVTVFSVSPRIHNLVFLFSSLTLFLSLNYCRRPSFFNFVLVFASAGLAFASAQSGLPAILLPLSALFLAGQSAESFWKSITLPRIGFLLRRCLIGLFIFLSVSLLVGYPGIFLALADGSIGQASGIILSSEHSQPSFSISGIFTLLRDWFFAFELVWLWPMIVLIAFFLARRRIVTLESFDWLAIAHIVAFLAVFGLSSVTVGRFSLAVMPSIFFLAGRLISRLLDRTWFALPLSVFMVIGLFVTAALSKVAFGGDTRAEAASFLIEESTPEERILSTVDRHSLGIIATPESIRRQAVGLGRTDRYIAEKNLISPQSRDFYYWVPAMKPPDSVDWGSFSLVVLSTPVLVQHLESVLSERGFTLARKFLPYQSGVSVPPEDFNRDLFGNSPVTNLFNLNRLGPAIYIFKKDVLE